MIQGIAAVFDVRPGDDVWIAVYISGALLLALPATYVATRWGLRAGLLVGVLTAIAVTLLAFVGLMIVAAIEEPSFFVVGFGLQIVFALISIFFAPALLVGLALAYAVRRLSRRASADKAP